jgi:hypothetical protein
MKSEYAARADSCLNQRMKIFSLLENNPATLESDRVQGQRGAANTTPLPVWPKKNLPTAINSL